jgi:hypothetical protein
MSKPTIRIHNLETNEVIDREMTDAEYAQFVKDQAAIFLTKTEAESKATAKVALLKKLGITETEAELLLA